MGWAQDGLALTQPHFLSATIFKNCHSESFRPSLMIFSKTPNSTCRDLLRIAIAEPDVFFLHLQSPGNARYGTRYTVQSHPQYHRNKLNNHYYLHVSTHLEVKPLQMDKYLRMYWGISMDFALFAEVLIQDRRIHTESSFPIRLCPGLLSPSLNVQLPAKHLSCSPQYGLIDKVFNICIYDYTYNNIM